MNWEAVEESLRTHPRTVLALIEAEREDAEMGPPEDLEDLTDEDIEEMLSEFEAELRRAQRGE